MLKKISPSVPKILALFKNNPSIPQIAKLAPIKFRDFIKTTESKFRDLVLQLVGLSTRLLSK